MSCNLLNDIAQGLYQGIGVDMDLTVNKWENPDTIGTTNSNVSQFTQMEISSINTYSITAQTINPIEITFSSIDLVTKSSTITNTLQLEISSLSTFSLKGENANFSELTASSINTYSIVSPIINFSQLVTSSISTFPVQGATASFQQLVTSSISTYSATAGSANFPQIATSSISNYLTVGTTASFQQIIASTIGTFSITGTTDLQQTTEVIDVELNASGNWPHNFNNGSIFYHSNIAGNFTTALINVPNTPSYDIDKQQNKEILITLILAQGATPYYSPAITVDGAPVIILWVDGNIPVPIANRIECETFNLFYFDYRWYAFGQYISFGVV